MYTLGFRFCVDSLYSIFILSLLGRNNVWFIMCCCLMSEVYTLSCVYSVCLSWMFCFVLSLVFLISLLSMCVSSLMSIDSVCSVWIIQSGEAPGFGTDMSKAPGRFLLRDACTRCGAKSGRCGREWNEVENGGLGWARDGLGIYKS